VFDAICSEVFLWEGQNMGIDAAHHVVDTLGLSRQAHDTLVAHYSRPAATPPDGRRTEARLPLSKQVVVLCQICDQHDSDLYFAVRPRDISPSGLGFLHGRFIHVGHECALTFILSREYGLRTTGTVAHCHHLQKQVHKVGIQFHEQVALQQLGVGDSVQ
jgi:hypothetical protein